jgi:ribosomal protein S18 acetylase RimI-like enzyme
MTASTRYLARVTTTRSARLDDLPRVAALEQASYPADEAATADMLAWRLTVAGDAFLVATGDAGEVVGFVCGTRAPGASLTHESLRHHDPAGESLCVHSVVVAPEARRRGIGSALVRAVVARARELSGVRRVLLICKEPLIELYRATGFGLIGPSEVTIGADPWFEMRLELAPGR